LWLCLTCGEISCGRKFFDGTGGNNHGVEHYQKTGHPLVVKLGTIIPSTGGEKHKADVYSYPEDDMVENPLLEQHLLHFGINIAEMKKTEKTMAELELDQNVTFDFSRIQESDKELIPMFGPGFTGLTNMGNTCYLASVMQVMFSIPEFVQRYRDEDMKIYTSNNDVQSLNFQL
jgi:ubiquitin carboxyl-terminal hydrolase 5/13